MLAHAAAGILLCLMALKTGGRRGKRRGQLSVFMFERNKGERRRGRGCLRQRCVRDHLFLLGQNTSLGPPAEEEAVCVQSRVSSRERKDKAQEKKPSQETWDGDKRDTG